MLRSLSTVTLSSILVASAASAANAQMRGDNWPNWYIGLHGQVAFVPDVDVKGNGLSGVEVSFDEEYGVGAALGYRLPQSGSALDNMRFELEYIYRSQAFDSLSGNVGGTPTSLRLNGDLTGNSVMGNVYYDFANDSGFTPYVGAGIGATFWDFDSSVVGVDDDDTVFSYQGMIGLYYSPQSIPNTDWGIGYRYFATLDPEFTTVIGGGLEHDYDAHNVELLARFRF